MPNIHPSCIQISSWGKPISRNGWKVIIAASPSMLGVILRYFGAHFGGMLLYFWELFPTKNICTKIHEIIFYEVLHWCFLYYFHSHSSKKNFTVRTPLLGELCNFFGPILGILLNALGNYKTYILLIFCMNVLILLWWSLTFNI